MAQIKAPKIVYIKGEEMTRLGMDLILDGWIKPHFDISDWEFYDLSVQHRDDTNDVVVDDIIEAGNRLKSIFKEPTITPTTKQKVEMGLKNTLGSPNGKIRRGWNGISISRDTIHIDGLELGYKNPVLFDRHAVGGEYGASWNAVGAGAIKTIHTDANGKETIVAERTLTDENNVVVTYENPLDNVVPLAHHFFSRSLAAGVTPYIVTKKTVFKWQEEFWKIFRDIYNAEYKEKFGGEELNHAISDAACMNLVKWKDGGFSMVAHNYDGDMLTDLMSQLHRSPGFISSVLVGTAPNGDLIKEFEASHGTVSDMYRRHLEGGETSLNPLGLAVALLGSIDYAAELQGISGVTNITSRIKTAMYKVMTSPKATRDLVGPTGSTTEEFVAEVAKLI